MNYKLTLSIHVSSNLWDPGTRLLLKVPIDGKYIPREISIKRKATKQMYLERLSLEDANCEATNVEDKNTNVAKRRILWAVADLTRILKIRDPIMIDNMKDAKIFPSGIYSCPLDRVGVQR